MTTTITLETHDKPVEVATSSASSSSSSIHNTYTSTTSHEYVPAHQKRTFHVFGLDQTITFRELQKGQTGLYGEGLMAGELPATEPSRVADAPLEELPQAQTEHHSV